MTEATVRSYSALRNTQREFEITMILRPNTSKDGIADLVSRLQAIYERTGGRMQKIDNWGLRTLAYPIQTNKKGIYLYIRFLGGSDIVKELERNLRIWDEVMRYLTVVVDGDVNPDARPSDIDDEILDAASDVAPDPLDIAAEKEAAFAAQAEAEAAAAAEAKANEAANDNDKEASADGAADTKKDDA
ncbi:30S ribosomal protein S6 [Enhygromyxa salina]|uniref:Small ribosomal subunit protein bS6 n=1 Tax=Enhygromyxa salina TaxID=215803 RepID=A0A2S9XBD4_9BACT|nr:30S ribosomal protein S6 [Enhygromyxa salina]PRP90169.1 30S ribosomal protein S6 [Enhygromyxa salina]